MSASSRRAAKTERIRIRNQRKTDIAAAKWGAKSTAYQNGIDPDKSKWEGITNITKTVADTGIKAMTGIGVSKLASKTIDASKDVSIQGLKSTEKVLTSSKAPYVMGGIALIALFAASKKW